jgi:SAM-dependent methyltransferase
MSKLRDEMLAINARQAAYYDYTDGSSTSERNGQVTNVWRLLRTRALGAVSGKVQAQLDARHRDWLGDASDKTVLEIGSGAGTRVSLHLAQHARAYHAIDLGAAKIDALRARIGDRPNVTLHVGDILATDFGTTRFDVIYARSVVHHFRHLEPLFERLDALLAPGGRIITFDPVQVWLPIRILRSLYRPFQTDADWEFPFTDPTLASIESHFHVIERVSVYRRAKWAMVLAVPMPGLGRRLGDRWFAEEVAQSASPRQVRGGLQVSYLLGRKGDRG